MSDPDNVATNTGPKILVFVVSSSNTLFAVDAKDGKSGLEPHVPELCAKVEMR
ncbi:MAG: hypothetical protein JO033_05510 [Acidobacteriaceae bacterium]|nr:hypothetical protein [Acidobacteriaceae bacterium]MBV9499466.1 hypothetical protein [Acidobacteriaceae bacterium]